MNNIRQLTKDEYPKAIELSWQVFTITGKEDFNNEGLEFFKSFIYNKKCINEIIFYGSFDNEALTGILGIKSNGKHISLFFIKYNPQNEMFRLLGTKRSFSQNETFFFSHPYPALFRLISHF